MQLNLSRFDRFFASTPKFIFPLFTPFLLQGSGAWVSPQYMHINYIKLVIKKTYLQGYRNTHALVKKSTSCRREN